MPSFNVTIDDSSPMVQYSGTWVDTPKTDDSWSQYENKTYHSTSEEGSTATLRFNGSAVYIFGSRKPGYGGYSVTVDGDNAIPVDAPATTTTVFNTLLYYVTSLDTTKEHEVVMKNVPASSGSTLDIDRLVITAGDGNIQTPAKSVFWKEDNPSITYSAAWITVEGEPRYLDGSAQLTATQSAYATITFNGSAIAVYGTTNTDHGMFGVSVDGRSQAYFNGSAPETRFRTLLFYANGLPQGQHVLKITNAPLGSGDQDLLAHGLDLDGISVSSWTDTPANSPSVPQGQPPRGTVGPSISSSATPPSRHLPIGVVIGSVIAAVAGVILFAVGLFLHCRYRQRRRRVKERHDILAQDGLRPDPFMTHLGGNLMMIQGNVGACVNKRPVSISSVASSTTPSHTFAWPTAAYRVSRALSTALSQPAVSESTFVERTNATTFGSEVSEKQRLVVLHAAPPSTTSTHSSPVSTDFAAGAEPNPHHGLLPSNHEKHFPFSHAS